jgi:hypothetical protein
MRVLASIFLAALALGAFPVAAGALPPTCESTACTDPVGHLLGPIGDAISPRP